MRDYQISQRRACVLIGVDPKTVRRERPPDHAEIREVMREIAAMRRRFGYRRVGVMLELKGHIMNHKKLYRLYREEGLSVRRRRGRKRARGSRTPMRSHCGRTIAGRWTSWPTRSALPAGCASLRYELLNEELFDSLTDARRKLAVWRYDYNNVRPHSSLGNRTPAQARRACLQDESVPPGVFVLVGKREYQTSRLSL